MNGDDLITLDEALAFIASWNEETHGEDARSSAKVHDIHDPFTLEEIDVLLDAAVKGQVANVTKTPSRSYNLSSSELQSASPPRKKRRVRSASSSSTIMQRRKKVEIETLREESIKLEAYLARLSTSGGQQKPLALTNVDEILSEWHGHALVQYQQRQQSEQTNRQLTEKLEKQQKLIDKLRGVLFKRNVLVGMEFVRTYESPIFEDSYFTVDLSTLLMNQLEEEVDGVYRNFHRLYRPELAPIDYPASETTYGEKCESNVMEFSTTTPMEWPMRAAFTYVWDFLDSTSDRSRKPNTLETRVNITLPIANHASCHFYKLHCLRKYEEEDRVVIIWSDLMQMTSRNLRLRSIAHSVFTPSKIDPSKASIMETFLKLYVEPIGGESVSPEDIRYGQEVILGAYGRLMRIFWQDQQNRLIEVTSCSL
ncbi:hypothetical protein PPTG_03485 [Phytophthora nicotianae INRA-310]|uniref:Uncharacterized protein n=1 Tax=Phytophthora nicotianae (strain INRA-310) TaxID=761204 RepID=W2R704_PHYN3|nr:hypothetical protein PPTG_03485 [Phytophthora nicotianae INRA-310]ETN20489.1 hypothetical protein PPTG_03485 [Phytophthora nicotianae INRA-310]